MSFNERAIVILFFPAATLLIGGLTVGGVKG